MKKYYLLALVICSSMISFSQITFEKGYIIDNENNKKECLIKNIEWLNNPTEIEYKFSENEVPKTGSIEDIKEFGVYNASKYIRQTVEMDRSSDQIKDLTMVRTLNMVEETVFLHQLIEGKGNLFAYYDGNLSRYFYSIDDDAIQPLIYKRYLNTSNVVVTNARYKQQLLNALQCPDMKKRDFEKLKYAKKELQDLFLKFNRCNGSSDNELDYTPENNFFHLNLRPGLNISTLQVNHETLQSRNVDFGSQMTGRIGLEAEFFMPFNKNKWSVIIEPTYQYFKSEKEVGSVNNQVDYKSIELPIGVRHHFYLNDETAIFINASFLFDLNFDSTINMLKVSNGQNFVMGAGARYKKYAVEVRYGFDRNMLWKYQYYSTEYSTLSFIVSYNLF